MFCAKCGKEMADEARFCPSCGSAVSGAAPTQTQANIQTQYLPPDGKSRISYILLGIFLGCLGIHNFYAGYAGRAITQLLITLLTGWLIIPWFCVWIWCIVEVCTVRKDAKGNYFVT